jgi:ribulose-5-phosphate 4-epimerase/fuculose-1-phosphate aldolase
LSTVREFDRLRNDLVVANRILAREDVVDAYGHVSIRHPQNPHRYFMARSVAPDLVTPDDIIEHDLEGNPVGGDARQLYLERFIHGGVYERRPDVVAVVHAHAEAVLPYTVAVGTPLRPVIHSASFIGPHVPVWDIADRFGDTNLLVANMEQGRDLAATLAGNNVALMRGHGFVAAARSVIEVVRLSVYLPRNARVLTTALLLGGQIKPLSPGEIDQRNQPSYGPDAPVTRRAWEYWANKWGCGHMIDAAPKSPDPHAKAVTPSSRVP